MSPAHRLAALALLGLPEDASLRDVVAAYRRLAKLNHPDTAGALDPDAGRRFTAITDAYDALVSDLATMAPEPPPVPDAGSEPEGTQVAVRVVREPSARHPNARPPIVAGPVRITPLSPKRRRDP